MKTFKDLLVWQGAMDLAEEIYRLSDQFPRHEQFGLTAQIRSSASSVPCNIAEGQGRLSPGEWLRFLGYARGSLYEFRTQLELCRRRGYLAIEECQRLESSAEQVGKALSGLISYVRCRARRPK